jgi:hypothetical protein
VGYFCQRRLLKLWQFIYVDLERPLVGRLVAVKLFLAPTDFFRARISRPPNWPGALLLLATICAGTVAVALATVRRGRTAVEPILAAAGVTAPANLIDIFVIVLAVTGFVGSFALMTGSLVFLDSLFSQSGRANRLIEFSAFAHAVQLPLILIAFALSAWGPVPAVRTPSGVLKANEWQELSQKYMTQLRDSPAQRLGRILSTYATFWIVAIQASALRIVSGFSVRGAWAAGCMLALTFGVGPWAWQMFWQH